MNSNTRGIFLIQKRNNQIYLTGNDFEYGKLIDEIKKMGFKYVKSSDDKEMHTYRQDKIELMVGRMENFKIVHILDNIDTINSTLPISIDEMINFTKLTDSKIESILQNKGFEMSIDLGVMKLYTLVKFSSDLNHGITIGKERYTLVTTNENEFNMFKKEAEKLGFKNCGEFKEIEKENTGFIYKREIQKNLDNSKSLKFYTNTSVPDTKRYYISYDF